MHQKTHTRLAAPPPCFSRFSPPGPFISISEAEREANSNAAASGMWGVGGHEGREGGEEG